MMRSNSSPPSTLPTSAQSNTLETSESKTFKPNGFVNSLLHHQDDVMARLEGSVKLDEVDMVELVHHLNLIPHHFLEDTTQTG